MQKSRSAEVWKRRERVRMRGYFIFLFLMLIAACAYADSGHDAVFKKGNQFYEKGDYDEAIKEYSRLLKQGLESGNLYFNLGNSYFKKGEHGKAVLNYERAKRLVPDDSDLKSNYAYALSKIENSPQGAPPPTEKVMGIFNNLTLDGLTVVMSVVYALMVLIITASIFIERVRRYRIIGIFILSLLFITGAAAVFSRAAVLDKEAIVVTKSAEARFEPLENATTHFTLYEGMKVYVLESKQDWSKVRRDDGKTGWLSSRALEKI
ncbi:MAG: tetratricopeptide repeat protein [Nitrospirae bacterium]|nr:tetratricopeptide repeat protein [Nitrospirota bacterium]